MDDSLNIAGIQSVFRQCVADPSGQAGWAKLYRDHGVDYGPAGAEACRAPWTGATRTGGLPGRGHTLRRHTNNELNGFADIL